MVRGYIIEKAGDLDDKQVQEVRHKAGDIVGLHNLVDWLQPESISSAYVGSHSIASVVKIDPTPLYEFLKKNQNFELNLWNYLVVKLIMLLPEKFGRLKGWNFLALTKIVQEAEIHLVLRDQDIDLIGGGIIL